MAVLIYVTGSKIHVNESREEIDAIMGCQEALIVGTIRLHMKTSISQFKNGENRKVDSLEIISIVKSNIIYYHD